MSGSMSGSRAEIPGISVVKVNNDLPLLLPQIAVCGYLNTGCNVCWRYTVDHTMVVVLCSLKIGATVGVKVVRGGVAYNTTQTVGINFEITKTK